MDEGCGCLTLLVIVGVIIPVWIKFLLWLFC